MYQLTNVAVFFGMYLGLARGESRQKRSRNAIDEIKNRRTSLHKGRPQPGCRLAAVYGDAAP